MSQVIRIPQALYDKLGKHVNGFETPAHVINRLLEHYEGKKYSNDNELSKSISYKQKKDTTKYVFNGDVYGKGRLVHAIVKYYSNNNKVSFDKLAESFPKSLQGSIGVFNKIENIKTKYANKPLKRHYLNPTELIQLTDCTVAVCTEWGIGNIDNFIKNAKTLGYKILKETP